VEELRAALPELPDAKRERLIAQYDLPQADAAILAADRDVADYYEQAVSAGHQARIAPKTMSNWMIGELFRLLKAEDASISDLRVTPAAMAELITLVEKGTITTSSGRSVLGEMFATGRSAREIVEEQRLAQISSKDALARIVDEVLAANPEQVAKYRDGKETLLQWFVGQVMRATQGKANPQVVQILLDERLRS
jgi:aspartyl-tRNA(Asn)/glutamyl-tRNA(Gln) amidotransferase subunit B